MTFIATRKLTFINTKLAEELADEKTILRNYGPDNGRRICQRLADLILHQLRISFFGFGLALGTEFQALSQLVGGKGRAIDLDQLFRDPHSSFDTASRQYSFMTIGPVSPLSFAGTLLFLNVFNTVQAFMKENNLQVGDAKRSEPVNSPTTSGRRR